MSRADFLDERRRMLTWYSDHLAALAAITSS